MTLSGSETVANYQAALRAVKYQNTSDNPSTATRTVSFKVNDGMADSNVLTRILTVNAVNDAPVAGNDSYSTNEDTLLTVMAPGVLTNDTDADGNPLTAAVVANPSHGTLTLSSNGSFTYTPATNYNGPDSFTYRTNDGTINSNIAAVSITVSAPGAPLGIAFVSPTPEDNARVTATSVSVAASISTNDLRQAAFHWNGADYAYTTAVCR